MTFDQWWDKPESIGGPHTYRAWQESCRQAWEAGAAEARAEISALRADAERYRWLRDKSVPPHNFYLSVPVEFDGVRYTLAEVDAYIDAAMKEGK